MKQMPALLRRAAGGRCRSAARRRTSALSMAPAARGGGGGLLWGSLGAGAALAQRSLGAGARTTTAALAALAPAGGRRRHALVLPQDGTLAQLPPPHTHLHPPPAQSPAPAWPVLATRTQGEQEVPQHLLPHRRQEVALVLGGVGACSEGTATAAAGPQASALRPRGSARRSHQLRRKQRTSQQLHKPAVAVGRLQASIVARRDNVRALCPGKAQQRVKLYVAVAGKVRVGGQAARVEGCEPGKHLQQGGAGQGQGQGGGRQQTCCWGGGSVAAAPGPILCMVLGVGMLPTRRLC
jgi:hypothetical protein